MTFSGCVVCPYLLNSAAKATSRQVAAGQGFNAHSFMKATVGQQTVLEKLCLESCQPAELGFMLPPQLLPSNTAPVIDFPINSSPGPGTRSTHDRCVPSVKGSGHYFSLMNFTSRSGCALLSGTDEVLG